MLIDIALARDGFINKKQTLVAPTNLNDFELCLKSIFDFVTLDLQGFDGISATIEVDNDPTNSLFIFNIDSGKYLYQIMTATPYLHLNKMLWQIRCIKLNNITELNDNVDDAYIIEKKTIPTTIDIADIKLINIKDNFETRSIIKYSLGAENSTATEYCLYTLKIKCFVDPTNKGLLSASPDGSFVFLIPIRYINGSYNSFISDGSTLVDIRASITKYAPNIKSIELVPFLVNKAVGKNLLTYGYDIDFSKTTNDTLYLTNIGDLNFMYTELGIFCVNPQWLNDILIGNRYRDGIGYSQSTFNTNNLKQALAFGGGIIGSVQTPQGIIDIDFSQPIMTADTMGRMTATILEEGFALYGNFYVKIPPHYINFYTDSSGNIFIAQNSTYIEYNKNLLLQKNSKENKSGFGYFSQLLGGLAKTALGSLSGNPLTAAGGIMDIVGSAVGGVNEKINSELDYNTAVSQYQNKIESDTAQAKLTGSQIYGQYGISDFISEKNNQCFNIIFELNYIYIKNDDIICQKDYDYSIFEYNKTYRIVSSLYQSLLDIINRTLYGNYEIILQIVKERYFSNNIILPIRF